jgi:hypothetical protein
VKLYHFSEDGGITSFSPHVPEHRDDVDAFVWAIDEEHAPIYYLPRDCPRACFWPDANTTDKDRERWFGGIEARMVIAVESAWLERIRSASLYRYEMPAETFALHLNDTSAGHWVSRETVEPLGVGPVGDLLAALAAADVELRVTPRLMQLWRRVTESTLAWSGTRLRNAQGYGE